MKTDVERSVSSVCARSSGRDPVEQELDDELRFHLEQQVRLPTCAMGLSRDDARSARTARVRWARADQGRTSRRQRHRHPRVTSARDLRHGLRQFRRSPGFTALAVLCLGLAIGVNTSIFGVLNSVLLRPMPVQQPERLIVVSRGDAATFSYPTYRDFRDRKPHAVWTDGIVADANPTWMSTATASSSPRRRCRPTTRGHRRPAGARALVLERRGAGGGHQLRRLAAPVQSRLPMCWAERSARNRSRTPSSASRRASSTASSRRCERTSGCRSARGPHSSRCWKIATRSTSDAVRQAERWRHAAQASSELNAIEAQLATERAAPSETQSRRSWPIRFVASPTSAIGAEPRSSRPS